MDQLGRGAMDWEGRRLFALAALVVYAAVTPAEAFDLRIGEVDLAGGMLWIRRHRGGGPGAEAVRIRDELRPILAGWRRRCGCEWLFPNGDRTGPWHDAEALRHLQAAARAAGIKGRRVTFERLRRYSIERIACCPETGGKSRHRRRPIPTRWDRSTRPSVEVRRDGRAYVRGKDKGILTAPQAEAIGALLGAGPRGLSKDGMTLRCGGKPGWRQVLIRLRRDRDWAGAIAFPGGGYPGKDSELYRILPL